MSSDKVRRSARWVGVVVLAAVATVPSARQPHFYPDDPITVDDDMALDASGTTEIEDSNGYDFVINTFGQPGRRHDVRAGNVTTTNLVPDSSWFVNRMGTRRLSTEDLVRGPDRFTTISLDGWQVSQGKSTGVQPGFRMIDPSGHLYQIEVDPPEHPEMATGAEIIGTAFYHAFGYHTVDVYLAELDPDTIEIAPGARIADPLVGARRALTRRDIDDVLRRAARLPNGRYRVLASRFADGRPLGNFRYYGTRPDDPNDIVPHEDRRELRGARVFAAWLNHDDSRGVNSLDMLHTDGSRRYVKHYMFDFGSMMGSGTVFAQRHRAGNEYLLEWAPGWRTLATLGLYTRPWLHITYPDVPSSVGRFEAASFDPVAWRPEYPNPAFDNMRADDAFWAASIVAAFEDGDIRAIVEKARYTDPRATEYITATLIERRRRVLRAWLTGVNPLVGFALDANGVLTFENLAVTSGVATAAATHDIRWARFDNTTGARSGELRTVVSGPGAPAPRSVVEGSDFVQIDIVSRHDDFPAWQAPVTLHFRRDDGGWKLVGVRRLP